jgi:hypothetical protein
MRTTILAFALAACGGGAGSVQGTIHGQSFAVADVVSAAAHYSSETNSAAVALTSSSNACSDLTDDIERRNGAMIVIRLTAPTGHDAAPPPGKYPIDAGSPMNATISMFATDTRCAGVEASRAAAVSGMITLTSIAGEAFGGGFDVVLDSGEHLSGDFDPVACPALDFALTGNWAPTCM